MINWFSHMFPYTNVHELNLDWIIDNFREFITEVNSLEEWKTQHEQEYEQLKAFQDAILSGNFPESLRNAFYTWCQNNITEIVGSLVHNVFFGLTDAGYFCAYIPDSWSDIIFNTTGLDINLELQPEYGHLVLSY